VKVKNKEKWGTNTFLNVQIITMQWRRAQEKEIVLLSTSFCRYCQKMQEQNEFMSILKGQ